MREYTIPVGGIPHTFLLSDEDAKARGLVPVKAAPERAVKQAAAPKNKARTAPTKG